MPKKIDQKVKERCVRQVLEHLPEYPSLTAAAEAVARREGERAVVVDMHVQEPFERVPGRCQ